MKHRLNWLMLLAIAWMIWLPLSPAHAAEATADEKIMTLNAWLQSHPETGRYTVQQWQSLEGNRKFAFFFAIQHGESVAHSMLSAENGDSDLGTQRKRLYMLKGWRMSPAVYATEAANIMREPAKLQKSIDAALLRAEANFARAAGQTERAAMLEKDANYQEYLDYKASKGNANYFFGSSGWHFLQDNDYLESFIAGWLEGIALTRASVAAGFAERPCAKNISGDAILEELKQASPVATDPFLIMLLDTEIGFIRKARAQ